MLKRLEVNHFALIDDLKIEFNSGLTALTGQTGSGKSILLESLSLLFGKRSDAEYIRHGEKKAIVYGEFILNDKQQEILGLPENINLTREIDSSGKHTVKLNNEIISLSRLKAISSSIGLIHGQNDTYSLLDKTSYVEFIDQMQPDLVSKLLEKYLIKRSSYLEAVKNFNNLTSRKNQSIEKIDFLTFQIKELEMLNLKKDEKKDLEDKIDKLKNFDLIKTSLTKSYENISSSSFDLDNLYDSYKNLEKISNLDESYNKAAKQLEDHYYNLEEIKKDIKSMIKNLDFDDDTFNMYQERVFVLNKIETKYKKDINSLIDYLNEIKEELALSSDYDNYIKEAKVKVESLYDSAYEDALSLSSLRKKLALNLQKQLTTSLRELDLDKAKFEIVFEDTKKGITLDESGIDSIEFMISLNEGEPLKALSKVASGGEKARFMFSLKSIFATNLGLSLIVFDEIDIGISGKTASKVALKMKELSKGIQTLVITHLPQVAAKADNHYEIYKEKIDSKIQTFIKVMKMDERILSIAQMLSDDKISSFAIEQAKSLLNN